MSHRMPPLQRGFSLIEALIALVITSFGLLAIAGVSLKLAHNEDVARQRGEAVRLAQEKLEELRSFTQIEAQAGKVSWEGLTGSTDTITDGTVLNGEAYRTNTTFERSWSLLDTVDDQWRRVQITVAWTDRVNGAADKQTLSFSTIVSKSDPFESGSLAFPLPGNTTLKRPMNRNLNIPIPATDLGNGQSVVQLTSTFAVVFSNDSGYVVLTCTKVITTAADLETGCTESNAYIVAGYVSLNGSASFPSGLVMNTAQLSGHVPGQTTCSLSDAEDQNTGNPIAGYKYYLCVVSVPSEGGAWSGTMRLAAPALNTGSTHYRVCRFQYADKNANDNMNNIQPYVNVADSLDNQNYVITSASTCPTITGLDTVSHQNCRGSGSNSNPNRANDCPAS